MNISSKGILKILIIYGVIAILVMQRANRSCHVKSGGRTIGNCLQLFLNL